jgi:hypothetical protein
MEIDLKCVHDKFYALHISHHVNQQIWYEIKYIW